MVFSTMLGEAMESLDPTIRNSNLFPVKAKGEVRFRSVASLAKSGRVLTPVWSTPPVLLLVAVPVEISWEITSCSCSPKNTEIMAGGASLAPRRWSFPGSAADSRSSSACSSTAFRMQASTSKNWIFSWGVLPGSSMLMPSSVMMDQLLCLPEPLTPAKGFS